jgi:integrase
MIEACLKRSAASKSGGKVFFSLQATSSGRLAVIAPAVPYRGSSLVTERLLELNPVTGTAKGEENGSRERVLTQDELRQLSRGLDDDGFGDIVRLPLLTGQRRNEIGLLQWAR